MYSRAEVLLREAFDTYVVEGWKALGEDVLLHLTECEKYLQKDKQYLDRKYFFNFLFLHYITIINLFS